MLNKKARVENPVVADVLSLKQRLPHISQFALCALLKISQEEGLPPHVHRKQIRAARDRQIREATRYGTLHQEIEVPTKDDKILKVEVQHPLAMLCVAVPKSAYMSQVFRAALAKYPCSPQQPWDLVLYNDEVTPGNPLAHYNARKSETFYWTCLQFGSHVLCNEDAWFELCVLRSPLRKTIKGGLSGLAAAVLKHLFFNPEPEQVDVSRAGVCFQLDDGTFVTIWLQLGIILADESALHSLLNFKGASGLKPCSKCYNVFLRHLMINRGITSTPGLEVVDQSCADSTKFAKQTDAMVEAVLRRLEAAKGSAGFDEFEKSLGWNLNEHGILMDPVMKHHMHPRKQTFYDWMHTIFQGGVFNKHVIQMLKALKRHGILPSTIYAYLQQWHWPGYVDNKNGVEAFSEKRLKSSFKAESLKCQASEGRSLCPVLCNLARSALVPHANQQIQKHGECFVLLAEFVSLIEKAAKYTVTPVQLKTSGKLYMDAFVELYGADACIFKFHMMLHFKDQLKLIGQKMQGDAFLPDCTVLERKHRKLRYYANLMNQLKYFNQTVIRELTVEHLHSLSTCEKYAGVASLYGAMKPKKGMLKALKSTFGNDLVFMSARKARVNAHEKVAIGDVVLFDHAGQQKVGFIKFHVSVQPAESDIAEAITFLHVLNWRSTQKGSSEYTDSDLHLFVPSASILKACIWAKSNGITTILR